MNVPKLDKREIEDIYRQLMAMIPSYVPEWRFNRNDPDPGTALFIIFAEMFQETIDRFNRVPLKNYLAFLNMLEIDQNSIVPAKGFAQFTPVTGLKGKVYVPADTALSSESSEAGGRVAFETDTGFFATPARITGIFNVDPVKDRIVKAFEASEEKYAEPGRLVLFDTVTGTNLQQHSFGFSEDSVLNIVSPSVISVTLKNSANPHMVDIYTRKLSDEALVEWSYYTGEGWKEFDRVEADTGRIVLYKNSSGRIAYDPEVTGHMPVRCSSRNINALKEIAVDEILVASGWNEGVGALIAPDDLQGEGSQIGQEGGYCFGSRFYQYSSMYIKSDEVFSKKGSTVELDFELDFIENSAQVEMPELDENIKYKFIMNKSMFKEPKKKLIDVARVQAEYWNGRGWVRLETQDKHDTLFMGDKGVRHMSFICPEDIGSISVNSIEGYWIRFRITDMNNYFYLNAVYNSPWLKTMSLKYGYKGSFRNARLLRTFNNAAKSPDIDIRTGVTAPVRLLSPIECGGRSVFVCFDEKPAGIPVNMYFNIISKYRGGAADYSWYACCRDRGEEGWSPLRISDSTLGFRRSGNISIESGYELQEKELFGIRGYWFRIDAGNQNEGELPVIDGIYMNTVEIIQRETYKNEMFLMDDANLLHSVKLLHAPVIDEEVWVNETGSISDDDLKALLKHSPEAVELKKDSNEDIKSIWIRWSRTDSLFCSAKDDRHYTIDLAQGILYFGDGKRGRNVTGQQEENICVNYHAGGGEAGNLREGAVNSISGTLPYIDRVRNIKPTCGGCSKQELSETASLGPAVLRNRGRAVTGTDYENLVRYNFNDARKVKCIANVDSSGEPRYGDITIVVMCRDYRNEHYSLDLCDDIRRFLMEKAFCGVSGRNGIHVVPPQLLNVNVSCDLTIDNMGMAMRVEKEINSSIESYLDPFAGFGGKGWEIGEVPRPAHFYSTIKKIPGVRYIEKINLDGSLEINGERKFVVLDKPVGIPFIVPVGGSHAYRLKTE